MSKKRMSTVFCLLCAVCMSLTGITGCGQSQNHAQTNEEADVDGGTAIGGADVDGGRSTDEETENMDMESMYRAALGEYLRQQLDLEEYDDQIAEIGCIPVPAQEQRDAQVKGNAGLKYIYVRNDIHLERLSAQDAQLLEESLTSDEPDARDLVSEMVVRTFAECITPEEIKSEEDKEVQTMYDDYITRQDTPQMVNMNSLVLQIATEAEYDENDNIVDEAKEREKEEALLKLAAQMESDMDGLLGDIPIRVFVDPVK